MLFLYVMLYLVAILCSASLFLPNFLPSYVKWPVALLVVLVVVFIFNLPKKDTVYTTHDTKRKIQNHGLFNPLIMYTAASIYVLGFTLIFTYLAQFNVVDLTNVTEVFKYFQFDFNNGLLCGLVFLVSAMCIYFIRNSFKNNACESTLKFRAFWYILFTVIVTLVGIFSLNLYKDVDLYSYLLQNYNIYVFFGLLALIIIIDLLGKLISHKSKIRKAKKASGELQREKEAKRAKVVEKERARVEKKLAKQEAKLNKKAKKLEAKVAKQTKKLEAKQLKKQKKAEAKAAKKANKKGTVVEE